MKKILDISVAAGRYSLVLLLLVALVSAGASSAERICEPVLEDEPSAAAEASGELKPDPLSEEADSDNMAGSSTPYSEQDAAQMGRWIAPTTEKPQGRRLTIAFALDGASLDIAGHRGPLVIGSLATAAPSQSHQATLLGAKPSGTM